MSFIPLRVVAGAGRPLRKKLYSKADKVFDRQKILSKPDGRLRRIFFQRPFRLRIRARGQQNIKPFGVALSATAICFSRSYKAAHFVRFDYDFAFWQRIFAIQNRKAFHPSIYRRTIDAKQRAYRPERKPRGIKRNRHSFLPFFMPAQLADELTLTILAHITLSFFPFSVLYYSFRTAKLAFHADFLPTLKLLYHIIIMFAILIGFFPLFASGER
jgi:hypothetical protein